MKRAAPAAIAIASAIAACGPAAPAIAPAPASASANANASTLRLVTRAPAPARFADPERASKLAALVPKLEKRVDDFFGEAQPPSLAVAMVADGRVVFTRILGVRDAATKAPATARTLYRIGSITKTFTAETVLALRDAGLLRLDEPAERWLPELAHVAYPYADAPRITLRHLLTHTSGLPRLGDFDYTRADVDVTEKEVLSAIDRARLTHVPGTTYVYSNFGLSIVGLILARAAPERSLREALAKHVTGPLAMTSTTYDPKLVAGAEIATGYAKHADPKPATLWRLGASEASGGLWSSLDDMSRWVLFQLAAWPPRADAEAGPLARATVREAHVPGFALDLTASVEDGHVRARANGIGFAWHTRTTCAYERIVEHGGSIDGFHSDIAFAPERGFGFVVLSSSIDTDTRKLEDTLFSDAADALAPRTEQASPELTDLVDRWAHANETCDAASGYEKVFSSSFREAISLEAYKKLCADFSIRHGACALAETISLDDPYDGVFRVKCDRGQIIATAAASADGGEMRLGSFFIRSTGLPPSKQVWNVASDMIRLENKWDSALYKSTFATTTNEAKLRPAFESLNKQLGTCTLPLESATSSDGDGARSARLPIKCERGAPFDLDLRIDDKGKVESVFFKPRAPKHDSRCTDAPKP